MVQALRRYLDLALQEVEALRSALVRDLENEDLQRRIQEFEHPTADSYAEPRARFFPSGETGKIIEGASVVETAYREAMAEAREGNNGLYLMPKLEAANESRRAIVQEAQQAYERSDDHLPSWEQHRGTFSALVDVVDQSPGPVGQAGPPAPAPNKPRPRTSVNARMLEKLQSDPDARGWNSKKWSQEVGAAKSSVVETTVWKDLQMARERLKAERAQDRRRRRKASDMDRD